MVDPKAIPLKRRRGAGYGMTLLSPGYRLGGGEGYLASVPADLSHGQVEVALKRSESMQSSKSALDDVAGLGDVSGGIEGWWGSLAENLGVGSFGEPHLVHAVVVLSMTSLGITSP